MLQAVLTFSSHFHLKKKKKCKMHLIFRKNAVIITAGTTGRDRNERRTYLMAKLKWYIKKKKEVGAEQGKGKVWVGRNSMVRVAKDRAACSYKPAQQAGCWLTGPCWEGALCNTAPVLPGRGANLTTDNAIPWLTPPQQPQPAPESRDICTKRVRRKWETAFPHLYLLRRKPI